MPTIPPEVGQFLDEGRLAFVATVSADGVPHCVPKGSMGQLDDKHLVFADLYDGATRRNLEANPHVAVTIVNPAAYHGYLIKGEAEIVPRGPAFDAIAAAIQRGQLNFNRAHHAVKIRVTEVMELSP